ncbi:CD225/dispanin family protein [Pontibacter sp. G13]|uniref:CD225/dispanin family protein n=1 Tax=Pontibacter sp. G13 TaxID=3074898 RepID=UPI00288BA167|nr:CD225/dispanin family protein [Pontibacter sp. G13]WNJ17395.1 CD225/dispanin family protein [Pontibacter sp. G13]
MRLRQAQPKSWMLESILLSIVFLPFGIIALLNARKVNAHLKAGEIAEAGACSAKAEHWIKQGVFALSVLIGIVAFLTMFGGIKKILKSLI